jgi:3-deoxy-manno-octulosonate cytidylyltransferase (CMP-KDO synthetase)
MKVIGVIPARYHSTRFPGKVLAYLWGKSLIQHVYERTARAKSISDVWVATDDKRIFKVVKGFKGKVKMTSRRHQSGTDRIAEAVKNISGDIILNVQGDEPLISPAVIDRLVGTLKRGKDIIMGSVYTNIKDQAELQDPNVVKVVINNHDNALYFSRSMIPFLRDQAESKHVNYYKHIGIYGYQRRFLLKLVKWPMTPLEKSEKLEQLRALENGFPIRMVKVRYQGQGVDTKEDLEKLRQRIKET